MKDWDEGKPMTEKEAETRIARAFPELGPLEVRTAGTGFDTFVFQVNEQYVFRFPRQEKGKWAMENENRILHRLWEEGVQLPFDVPQPQFYAPGEDGAFPFVGFSYVPGHELAEEKNVDLLGFHTEALAEMMKQLHTIELDDSWQLPEDELLRLSSKKRRPMLLEYLDELKEVCDPRTRELLEMYLYHIPEWENPPSSVLVHGDLHPKNLIAREGRLSGVIDWGDAHYGHPASDLALVFQALPAAEHDRFFERYGAIDEETKQLAVFKAVFVSTALARYAVHYGEDHVRRWCEAGVRRAIQFWQEDALR
ncbi:phosphotransferase [Alkalicoccus chagannorensis]|uniref:phosphotransferase n=1 Tax=Alkalicoccus chagannorensis TaxID=427072 RepID=UPI0003F9AF06|nr:phosphotransferase [Alkalicoccus chagannorensis]